VAFEGELLADWCAAAIRTGATLVGHFFEHIYCVPEARAGFAAIPQNGRPQP